MPRRYRLSNGMNQSESSPLAKLGINESVFIADIAKLLSIISDFRTNKRVDLSIISDSSLISVFNNLFRGHEIGEKIDNMDILRKATEKTDDGERTYKMIMMFLEGYEIHKNRESLHFDEKTAKWLREDCKLLLNLLQIFLDFFINTYIIVEISDKKILKQTDSNSTEIQRQQYGGGSSGGGANYATKTLQKYSNKILRSIRNVQYMKIRKTPSLAQFTRKIFRGGSLWDSNYHTDLVYYGGGGGGSGRRKITHTQRNNRRSRQFPKKGGKQNITSRSKSFHDREIVDRVSLSRDPRGTQKRSLSKGSAVTQPSSPSSELIEN